MSSITVVVLPLASTVIVRTRSVRWAGSTRAGFALSSVRSCAGADVTHPARSPVSVGWLFRCGPGARSAPVPARRMTSASRKTGSEPGHRIKTGNTGRLSTRPGAGDTNGEMLDAGVDALAGSYLTGIRLFGRSPSASRNSSTSRPENTRTDRSWRSSVAWVGHPRRRDVRVRSGASAKSSFQVRCYLAVRRSSGALDGLRWI